MKILYSRKPIGSVAALAQTLGVIEAVLISVADDAASYYSFSSIVKKNGGTRQISDPLPTLKVLQRRIVRRIFSGFIFPDYLFGSVKDEKNPRDFVRNAQYHTHAYQVMAFDIESFFPSVQVGDVKSVFKYLMRLPDDVAEILLKLTTLPGGLPQGAPTSSYLANLIFYDNEHKFVRIIRAKKLIYSRLVDDITISSSRQIPAQTKKFIHVELRKMLSEKMLKISEKKYRSTNTEVIGAKTVITGLVVEKALVKMPAEKVKKIGGLVYGLVKEAEVCTTEWTYHRTYCKTSGLVALFTRLDPMKAETYRNELRDIRPTYTAAKIKKVCWLCRKFVKFGKAHPFQLSTESYTRKFYRFKQKISIIARTNKSLAKRLHDEMQHYKPTRKVASFYE